MEEGRLIKGIGGFYYVEVDNKIYECKARGIFRKNQITPLVGDYVKISILDHELNLGVIEEIMERKNQLIRPPVANVDQAIIVFAVIQPDPHLSLLDRFLVLAESQDLDVVICLTKLDLASEDTHKELLDTYRKAGYPIVLTSSKKGEGIEKVRELLSNKVTVFAGPSGVGKSTLLNQIQPGLNLKTGEISEKIARGKHTTRHVELLPLGQSGWVVDTPGFSSLNIDFIEEEELGNYFPEFDHNVEDCRFASCLHLNEPHCGIKGGVKTGAIAENRYNSYVQFIEEIRKNRRY